MKGLKRVLGATAIAFASLAVNAAEVSFGGVTWDEDASNPLAASFVFNQWYTTDSSNPLVNLVAVPSSPADIGNELFAFGEFTGFTAGRESQPTDNTAFTDGAELTFTLTGVVFDPTSPNANSLGLDASAALLTIYIDDTRDLSQTNYNDWADASNDGDVWARFTFDFFNLSGGLLDGQLVAGLSFLDSFFVDAANYLDSNANGPDFILNSSAQFNANGGTITEGANGQIIRAIPEPASLAIFGLGLIGLAGAVRRKKA